MVQTRSQVAKQSKVSPRQSLEEKMAPVSKKRKAEHIAIAEQSTADLAGIFRKYLLHYKAPKRFRVQKRRTINLDAMNISPEMVPFFEKLPREIRDQIYGYVWEDNTGILQRYKRKYYKVTYGDRKDWNASTASWLLTNKRMFLEGIAEFVRHAVWHFEPRDSDSLMDSEYIFPLITPGLVHTHHLHLGYPRSPFVTDQPFAERDSIDEGWAKNEDEEDEEDDGRLKRYFWLRKDAITLINTMTASMELSQAVKEIKVTITIPKNIASAIIRHAWGEWPAVYSFDFTELERLAVHRGLRVFKADIVVQMVGIPNTIAEMVKAKEALMDELERIGSVLVEGGSVVKSTSRNPVSGWDNWDLALSVRY
ncbi:Nn.00g000510.m01.CDS01 [Neocucurbitaria sp. VM-36]